MQLLLNQSSLPFSASLAPFRAREYIYYCMPRVVKGLSWKVRSVLPVSERWDVAMGILETSSTLPCPF